MRASICVGNYAENAYYVAGLDLPVYSVEELCYCMKENAFLLDTSLMNDTLLEWLDRECGLRELSRQLYPMVHRQGSLSAFVCGILEYAGFYDEPVVEEVGRVLKQGAGLSNLEKRKTQIDNLLRNRRYTAAIRGYDGLLANWQNSADTGSVPASEVRAGILYGKAVACTRLMRYGQAAEAFLEAYHLTEGEELFAAYLAAKRMELTDREYVALVAELPGSYGQSLELEKRLEDLELAWKVSQEHQELLRLQEYREEGDHASYEAACDRLLEGFREEYREFAQS